MVDGRREMWTNSIHFWVSRKKVAGHPRRSTPIKDAEAAQDREYNGLACGTEDKTPFLRLTKEDNVRLELL